MKPDVVLEGGNVARDQLGISTTNSLSLLTTNNRPHERMFTTVNATKCGHGTGSAACCFCDGGIS